MRFRKLFRRRPLTIVVNVTTTGIDPAELAEGIRSAVLSSSAS